MSVSHQNSIIFKKVYKRGFSKNLKQKKSKSWLWCNAKVEFSSFFFSLCTKLLFFSQSKKTEAQKLLILCISNKEKKQLKKTPNFKIALEGLHQTHRFSRNCGESVKNCSFFSYFWILLPCTPPHTLCLLIQFFFFVFSKFETKIKLSLF